MYMTIFPNQKKAKSPFVACAPQSRLIHVTTYSRLFSSNDSANANFQDQPLFSLNQAGIIETQYLIVGSPPI
jgi:hypothetical protein